VFDVKGIDPVSGMDAGRRQGFGKDACCWLSCFRLQAKTRELPAASNTPACSRLPDFHSSNINTQE